MKSDLQKDINALASHNYLDLLGKVNKSGPNSALIVIYHGKKSESPYTNPSSQSDSLKHP